MCGGTTNTTNTTTQQSMSPQMQQSYQDLMSSAKNQAATPYQTYDGPRVAPLSQGQAQAVDTAQAMQGNYEGDLNSARAMTGLGAGYVAGSYYTPQNYSTQAIGAPTISPGTAQAQYAQAQYAPQAAQAGVQQARAQQAQAQSAQAQSAQAQQAGYAQAQVPGNVQAQGIGAMQIGSGHVGTDQFGQQAFQQYGSPYQQDVINSTMAELNRQKTLDQNTATSQATLGGAFGGDRAAVQQAEIGRNYGQIQAQALAGLNNQNWAQAQNMFTNDQARGLQAQGMNQSAGLQASMANQGTNLQAQQANQSAGLQAALANQGWQGNVGLANMGAINTAQLANAQLGTQANLQNANLGTQTSQFNAGLGTQNSQFNAGLGTQTSQFNAGQGNQVGMYNAGQTNQNNQFNAGMGTQNSQFNAGLGTQNSQFNTGLNYQGQAQNAANSLQAQQFNSGQSLQAQQLNDQSKQYYANLAQNDRNRQLAAGAQYMGITGQEQQAKLNDIGALMQTGNLTQQQQQQNYNTAYNDFVQQRQYPFQTIGWQSDIYHGIPAPMSSSGTTQTPGPNLASSALGAVGTGIGAYMAYAPRADGGMVGADGFDSGDDSGMASGYAPGGQVQTDIYGRPMNPGQMGGPLPVQTPAPTGFWDAGPSGVSPAMSIFGAIGRQQGPQFLSNVAAGAGEGMQDIGKQRLLGAQISDAQSQAAQRNMVAQQAAALANARSGLMQRIQERKGGMGPGGAAPSPSMPGGAAPSPGLPGGPGQAGAGPVPGSPAPGVPTSPGAPPTPPGSVSPQPIPSQQPAGQPVGSSAMGVPTSPGQQVAAPAAPGGPGPVDQQRPGLPAETIMQSPSLATAPSTTAAQHAAPQQGADLSNLPLLQNDLATVSAWDGNPLTADLIKPSAERLMEVAKTGKTFDASGNETFAPGHLANLAAQTYIEADAKGRGELPSKMQFMQAEQGAIGNREIRVGYGLVGAENAKVKYRIGQEFGKEAGLQTHAASLDMIHPVVPEIGPDGKPTGRNVEQNMTRLQGVGVSHNPGMAGFGAAPTPAAAPTVPVQDVPLPAQVQGATSAASAAPALPEAPPPQAAPAAPAAAASAAPQLPGFPGPVMPTHEQEVAGSGYGEMPKQYREAADNALQGQQTISTLRALAPTVATGQWADAKVGLARIALGLGMDKDIVNKEITNAPNAEAMQHMFVQLTGEAVRKVGPREPGMIFNIIRDANPQLESTPQGMMLMLAGSNQIFQREVDRNQALQSWQGPQGAKSAAGFDAEFTKTHPPQMYANQAFREAYSLPPDAEYAGNAGPKYGNKMIFKTTASPKGFILQ